MEALLMTATSLSEVLDQMKAYVAWVAKVQQMSDPHGQSVLTEPKVNWPKQPLPLYCPLLMQ